MTLASSWIDLVVGMDIHMHLVPTPAGPVPTPLPQPFVGMVGDPVNEIVSAMSGAMVSLVSGERPSLATGMVLINGLPATTTNSSAKNSPVLRHVPMPPGTAHVNPPAGDASFPMGALKISFGGSSAIVMGDMARSCADPVPMPTSRVVAIPKGAPVMVNGTPGLNLQKAIAGWAMGKLIRTAFRGVSALARYVGRLSGPRLRNLISKAKCFVTGHPVDIATGRVLTEAVDFSMSGPLPLVFERNYFSSWSHRDGPLGPGWSHSLDLRLWFEGDLAVFQNAEGQEIVFLLPDRARTLEVNQEVYEPISGNTLSRTRDGWQIVTPEGLVHTLHPFGDVMRVVRTTKRNTKVGLTYDYDAEGRLTSVTDCGGRTVKLEYDSSGRLQRLLGPEPVRSDEWIAVVEYAYTPEGLLAEVHDSLGHATQYEYDGALMVQETDRNGVAFFWTYDGRGTGARCVRTWGQSNGEVIYNHKIDYDAANRTTLVTNSYDAKTLYKMNLIGAVVEVIDAMGGKASREYDDDLHLVAEIDQLGSRTTHHYGPRGQLVGTVYPDGSRLVMKHDRRWAELLTLRVDQQGGTWRYQYDSAGQLVEIRGPEPDAWRRYEWENGFLAATIEANGARTEVTERDRWRNAALVRLPNGAIIRREFDCRGRCVSATDAYGRKQTIAYDGADRVIAVAEADGTLRAIARDPVGNVIEIADRHGRTRFTYANLNKLASREEVDTQTKFSWGQEGELREVRNEKNQDHRFEYDPCLRLEREIGFDLQETRYHRNAAGWATKIEKAKARLWTEYAHDNMGRVVSVKHSDGTWARFGYRKDGELVEATNETTSVLFDRDGLGRVTKEIQGDVEVRSFYTGGFRTRLESSLGAGLAVERDTFGNPTAISLGGGPGGGRLAFDYDDAGLEIRRTLPAGVTAASLRDEHGHVARQDVVAPDMAGFSREYTWTYDNRITRVADSRFGLADYEHDAHGRLIAERRGDHVQHRAFDAIGNLYKLPDQSDRRYVRGGIIRHDGDTTFAFDLVGNMVERNEPGEQRWAYRWDAAGMLVDVTRPDGLQVTFTYDALGRRVGKKAGSAETRWIWDGDVILHELHSDHPPTTWYHEPESFAPLMQVSSGCAYHVIDDQLGTPTAMYDDTGRLAWQMQLDLFGVAQTETDAKTDCPFRCTGQYHDEETGLHYNRFRYYDPSLGQYISPDPLSVEGGLAVYAYVIDPLTWVDPVGLSGCQDDEGRFVNLFPEDPVRAVSRYKLEQRAGKWVTVSATGRTRSATGHYIFVRQNDTIFVQRETRAGHIDLAGGRPVDYGGQIQFSGRNNRGTLRTWNNGSGHYQPLARLAQRAGLPMDVFEALF
jgi:RHS repeat-associated protein